MQIVILLVVSCNICAYNVFKQMLQQIHNIGDACGMSKFNISGGLPTIPFELKQVAGVWHNPASFKVFFLHFPSSMHEILGIVF